MWLWQQRHRVPKKYVFLSKLLLFCGCCHGLLMFMGLFLYHGDDVSRTINLTLSPMAVVYLPFYKPSASERKSLSTMAVASSHNLSSSSAFKKGTTTLAQASTITHGKKRLQNVIDAKKEKKNKKDVSKKIKAEPKQQIQKKEEKIEVPHELGRELGSKEIPLALPTALSQQELGLEEVIYAGQAELDALELANEIREEIIRLWKPPVGLSSDQCCKVRVVIDREGKAQDVVIEESSRILAFDTSVRHALLKMNFPKGAYGKELILPFR